MNLLHITIPLLLLGIWIISGIIMCKTCEKNAGAAMITVPIIIILLSVATFDILKYFM